MKIWRSKAVVTLGIWIVTFFLGYFAYQYFLDQQYAHAAETREELRAGLAKAEDLSTAFRNVGKLVEPSVVNIEVHKKAPASPHRFDNDFFRRFFPDRNGDGEPDLPPGMTPDEGDDGSFEQIGTGSGVIMEYSGGKGYILTNNHVAGGAEELDITLADGRKITNGKVLGADAKTDLAVVEIQAERLVAAKWGNSDELRQGDWIVAFGSPFGYVGSMTHGIISALHRTSVGILGRGGYENFIQVDAPINPGNSGGPLVNLHGEVVGINTAIASRNGGFQGIGFAIPSSQAQPIYTALKTKGKVVRGWLGVGIKDVSENPKLAKSFGYKGDHGVLVEEVLEGTPAIGKLHNGDIITQVNGKPVQDVSELRIAIALMAPGTEVKMTVFRNGKTEDVSLKLGEQPENVATLGQGGESGGAAAPSPETSNALDALGLRVETLTANMAQRLNLNITSGVAITRVNRNSPAAREGLRVGDVITQVGNTPVKNVDDLTAAMKKEDVKKGVRLYVTSREGSRFVFLSTEK